MNPQHRTRIVYVNHTGQVSGAERVLLHMLRVLDRERYECMVLCPANGPLPELVRTEGVTCIEMAPVEARFTWRPERLWLAICSLLKSALSMRRQLANLNPDILHANTLRSAIAVTVASIGMDVHVVWHVHDMLPHHPASSLIRLLAWISKRVRVVAVSLACARRFSGGMRLEKKMMTIHNGVDLVRYPRKREGGSGFRRSIGVSEGAFLICTVGQICTRKGQRELIEAFAAMRPGTREAHLAIVGRAVFAHEEGYCASLHQLVSVLGVEDRVHFTGELRDASAALQDSDLFVLNSREEPFGLVLVEAMSSGTPVLATRVGGIPEIVEDGQTGWLIESGDVQALTAKLITLCDDRAALSHVAERALRTTCAEFSLERFKGQLHGLYTDLVAHPIRQLRPEHRTAPAQPAQEGGEI